MKSKIEQIIQKAINTNCNLEANEYLKNAMNLVYNDKIMTNQEKIFILNKIDDIAISRNLPTQDKRKIIILNTTITISNKWTSLYCFYKMRGDDMNVKITPYHLFCIIKQYGENIELFHPDIKKQNDYFNEK